MRSESVFRAKEIIGNRYQLCQTVSKATRKIHISSRNTQETINSAFEKIADSRELPATVVVAGEAGSTLRRMNPFVRLSGGIS
ncbi:DNA-directed RNA polymerase subunit omega [Edaphobacter modestus]|uniref:Uncharacterized protein n=1 Tax=Edaphobacter modestus TaxID=388466 RepID=A0A4Q7YUL6_9BACT|nr:DNA-directed RNA polymerase subunit omega [Edaphobacter modestus]RZU41562.1 hypothetical protein BDD14_3087 [Edaphobacter modestus]